MGFPCNVLVSGLTALCCSCPRRFSSVSCFQNLRPSAFCFAALPTPVRHVASALSITMKHPHFPVWLKDACRELPLWWQLVTPVGPSPPQAYDAQTHTSLPFVGLAQGLHLGTLRWLYSLYRGTSWHRRLKDTPKDPCGCTELPSGALLLVFHTGSEVHCLEVFCQPLRITACTRVPPPMDAPFTLEPHCGLPAAQVDQTCPKD